MKRFVFAGLMVCLFASAAYGSLYYWNPKMRPQVSLADALRRADRLLGDDAENRYCTGATLYGNEKGDGKEGTWNLYYSAADGSRTLVTIAQTGKGFVGHYNGAVDWGDSPGRRTGLDDIATHLNDVMKANGYGERATVKAGRLTLRARSRTFRVYPMTKSGAFADELVDVIGPKRDGVIIEADELDHPDREAYSLFEEGPGPYWRVKRSNHLLTGNDRFVRVEMRYGAGLPTSLFVSLLRAFGEREAVR